MLGRFLFSLDPFSFFVFPLTNASCVSNALIALYAEVVDDLEENYGLA